MALRSTSTASLRVHRSVLALALALPASALAQQQPTPATTAAQPASGTYEVRLHRPMRVGQRRRITVHGEQHMVTRSVTWGQQPDEHRDDVVIDMDAVERVMAVDARGAVTQSEFTIRRFNAASGPAGVTYPRAGQVLNVTRGASAREAVVTLDGQPCSAALRHALEAVTEMSVGSVSDDDVFGTTQRQAPGASWPIHSDVAERDLANHTGMEATLSGQTRLVERTVVRGVDALELAATLHGNINGMRGLPPGGSIRGGTMDVTFRGTFPVDTARPRLTQGMEMRIRVQMSTQERGQTQDVSVELNGQRTESATAM